MRPSKVLLVKNITREGPGLIEKVLEEQGIAHDLIDLEAGDVFPDLAGYRALIVFGGPDSANDETPKIRHELGRIRTWRDSGRPFLGICLGLQLMVKALGGEVYKNPVKEVGFRDPAGRPYRIDLTPQGHRDPLFANFEQHAFPVFQLHGETVRPTPSMILLGEGIHCRHQVVKSGTSAYGLQCHFELTRELLLDWLAEDEDLLRLNRGDVLRDFDEMFEGYTAAGRRLMMNFFTLAGCCGTEVLHKPGNS